MCCDSVVLGKSVLADRIGTAPSKVSFECQDLLETLPFFV